MIDDDEQPLITINGIELAGWARRHRKFVVVCCALLVIGILLFVYPFLGSSSAPQPEPQPARIAASVAPGGEQFKNDLNGEVVRVRKAAGTLNLANGRLNELNNEPEAAQAGAGQSTTGNGQQTQGSSQHTTQQTTTQPKQDSGFGMAKPMGQNNPVPVQVASADRQQRELQDLIDRQKAYLAQSIAQEQKPPMAEPHGPTLSAAPAKSEYNEPAKLSVLPPAPGYYRISMGRTIPCILLNRIDGEFAGPVTCSVSVTGDLGAKHVGIYSDDNQHFLIPRGSIFVGNADAVSGQQQKRIQVEFTRVEIRQPDGSLVSYDLDKFPGLDQQGATAVGGKVNSHLLSALLWSLPIGAVNGASMASTNLGYGMTGLDAERLGIAQSTGQAANQSLGRRGPMMPTITIPFGQRIELYVAKDFDLPEAKEQL